MGLLVQEASGKWQMASGKWQVASGKWQVARGSFASFMGRDFLLWLRRKD
jgi:hypothetical protein